ncbi:MAG: hypothetical protein ACETWK_05015 [Candidatus Aminicenantaceae bacterium]
MPSKKVFIALLSLLLAASILFSQSLVELAKKEKQRRTGLKGKKGIVVTNNDLRKVRKRTGVSVVMPRAEEEGESSGINPPEEPPFDERLSSEFRSEKEKIFRERKASLEAEWSKAKEFADLLALKMNGLWQEFYSFNDMTSRDKIQREISDTYLKLLKARQDEARAQEAVDQFIAQARKEGVPPGWIREK